jgi:hypothetical protein
MLCFACETACADRLERGPPRSKCVLLTREGLALFALPGRLLPPQAAPSRARSDAVHLAAEPLQLRRPWCLPACLGRGWGLVCPPRLGALLSRCSGAQPQQLHPPSVGMDKALQRRKQTPVPTAGALLIARHMYKSLLVRRLIKRAYSPCISQQGKRKLLQCYLWHLLADDCLPLQGHGSG